MAARFGGARDAARVLDPIGLDERGAHGLAARREERVGHRAADQQRVGVRRERLEHGELVGDLGAAEDHEQRALGLAHDAQVFELALQQIARGDARRRSA